MCVTQQCCHVFSFSHNHNFQLNKQRLLNEFLFLKSSIYWGQTLKQSISGENWLKVWAFCQHFFLNMLQCSFCQWQWIEKTRWIASLLGLDRRAILSGFFQCFSALLFICTKLRWSFVFLLFFFFFFPVLANTTAAANTTPTPLKVIESRKRQKKTIPSARLHWVREGRAQFRAREN